jgi:hypothetical protein
MQEAKAEERRDFPSVPDFSVFYVVKTRFGIGLMRLFDSIRMARPFPCLRGSCYSLPLGGKKESEE